MCLVYFNHEELETLKQLIIFLFDTADDVKDPHLWEDTKMMYDKVNDAMKTYGGVVGDEMNGE